MALLVKNMPPNAGDMGSILGSGRSPGVGNGNPLQYSCLENPCTQEPGRLQSIGSHQSQTWLKWFSMHTHTLVGIKKEKNFAFWKVKEFEVNGEKYWVSFFILLPINDTLKICMQSWLLRLGDNSAGLSSLWYEYTEGIWQFSINTLFEVSCFSVILKCSLLLRPQCQLLHFI